MYPCDMACELIVMLTREATACLRTREHHVVVFARFVSIQIALRLEAVNKQDCQGMDNHPALVHSLNA